MNWKRQSVGKMPSTRRGWPRSPPRSRWTTTDGTDADRLLLLDRLAKRMPDLDLGLHEIGWTKLEDGNEALVVDGGGFDGGTGYFIANGGDDLHVVGPTAPLVPGKIGCVLIHGDGTRELAKLIPDPLADRRGGELDERVEE